MAPDDSEIDSAADAAESDVTRAGAEPAGEPTTDLAARLSATVPSRRTYGAERITADSGLLTARERQYLRHAHRLDDDDRDAVESVVADRVGEFVETDWPVIRENCPEVASTLREELCVNED
ncbi:MAG: hypothetical protein ACOCQL_01315 [Halolamina sp.]